MPQLQAIPTATDSYDQRHSTLTCLTSLRALAASTDAIFSSLTSTVDAHAERLRLLSLRAERCRAKIERLKDTDAIDNDNDKDSNNNDSNNDSSAARYTIHIPSLYSKATNTHSVSSELMNLQDELASGMNLAREASNHAIRSVLERDAQHTMAAVSDVWLDRVSAFEETKACKTALRMDVVPPLIIPSSSVSMPVHLYNYTHNRVHVEQEESRYYQSSHDAKPSTPTSTTTTPPTHSDTPLLEPSSTSQPPPSSYPSAGDSIANQSHASTLTQTSIHSHQSLLSNVTASYRRRQRIMAASIRRRHPPRAAATPAVPVPVPAPPLTGSRQQALRGSRPYLCEVLHDAHGVGDVPPNGQAGGVFGGIGSVEQRLYFCDLVGRVVEGGAGLENGGLVYGGGGGGGGVSLESLAPVVETKSGGEGGSGMSTGMPKLLNPKSGGGGGGGVAKTQKTNPASYRPDALAKDAGVFQLPQNLPLSDANKRGL